MSRFFTMLLFPLWHTSSWDREELSQNNSETKLSGATLFQCLSTLLLFLMTGEERRCLDLVQEFFSLL